MFVVSVVVVMLVVVTVAVCIGRVGGCDVVGVGD